MINDSVNFIDPEGLASSGIPKKVPGTNATVRIDPPAPLEIGAILRREDQLAGTEARGSVSRPESPGTRTST